MKPTQAILRHVRAHGLTIAPVAARALRMPTADAHAVLEDLVRTNALTAHRAGGALYFTNARRALDEDELREAFGVLWFCCMSHPERPLLAPNLLRERVALAERASGQGISGRARCYVTPDGELSLLRIAHEPPGDAALDLQRVLGGLQRLASSRQFRPWRIYARSAPFSLTLLLEDDAKGAELAAWLARHPLVALAAPEDGGDGAPAGVVIPVRVGHLERLRRR